MLPSHLVKQRGRVPVIYVNDFKTQMEWTISSIPIMRERIGKTERKLHHFHFLQVTFLIFMENRNELGKGEAQISEVVEQVKHATTLMDDFKQKLETHQKFARCNITKMLTKCRLGHGIPDLDHKCMKLERVPSPIDLYMDWTEMDMDAKLDQCLDFFKGMDLSG